MKEKKLYLRHKQGGIYVFCDPPAPQEPPGSAPASQKPDNPPFISSSEEPPAAQTECAVTQWRIASQQRRQQEHCYHINAREETIHGDISTFSSGFDNGKSAEERIRFHTGGVSVECVTESPWRRDASGVGAIFLPPKSSLTPKPSFLIDLHRETSTHTLYLPTSWFVLGHSPFWLLKHLSNLKQKSWRWRQLFLHVKNIKCSQNAGTQHTQRTMIQRERASFSASSAMRETNGGNNKEEFKWGSLKIFVVCMVFICQQQKPQQLCWHGSWGWKGEKLKVFSSAEQKRNVGIPRHVIHKEPQLAFSWDVGELWWGQTSKRFQVWLWVCIVLATLACLGIERGSQQILCAANSQTYTTSLLWSGFHWKFKIECLPFIIDRTMYIWTWVHLHAVSARLELRIQSWFAVVRFCIRQVL